LRGSQVQHVQKAAYEPSLHLSNEMLVPSTGSNLFKEVHTRFQAFSDNIVLRHNFDPY
jgi:hypothetical protein